MAISGSLFLATDAHAYEHFMARWSRRLAGPFLDFAGVRAGERVLDVGCGTGVITIALAEPVGRRSESTHRNLTSNARAETDPIRRSSMSKATLVACDIRMR